MFHITFHLANAGGDIENPDNPPYKRNYEWQFDCLHWEAALTVLGAFGVEETQLRAMRDLCAADSEEYWEELEVPHGGDPYGALIDFSGSEGPYKLGMVKRKDGTGFEVPLAYPGRRIGDQWPREHPDSYGQIGE